MAYKICLIVLLSSLIVITHIYEVYTAINDVSLMLHLIFKGLHSSKVFRNNMQVCQNPIFDDAIKKNIIKTDETFINLKDIRQPEFKLPSKFLANSIVHSYN